MKWVGSIFVVAALVGGLYLSYSRGYLSRFLPQSYADFSVNGGKVNINLSIDRKDQKNYQAFLDNLGAKPSENLSFQLDKVSTQFLSSNSPQRVKLTFIGDRELQFQSNTLPALPSALFGKSYDYASKSAVLTLNYQDEKDYSVKIKDPGVLLEEATRSAKLYLSKEVEGIFPIASKIATIDIRSDGGALSGDVVLK